MLLELLSSLWFVPLAMVGASAVLAIGLTLIDVQIGSSWTSHKSLVFGIGASGARGMLAAIAGSMMTVASLTFSLTISTLATASAQYTSRLVRNFMRDTVNQFVLGYFVSLFAYCLIVLRTIRAGDEGQFVPALAVLGGLILALLSIVVLIYFIHHIAESIQAATILRNVTHETIEAIDRLFPAGVADTAGGEDAAFPRDGALSHRQRARAEKFGFVQSVDTDALLALAVKRKAIVRMTVGIGAFVTPEEVIAEMQSPDAKETHDLADRMRGAFNIGSVRTIEQDAAFGIRQIVDIALKAMSPGINDATTGVMSVEHLSVILEALASRSIPDQLRAQDGVTRLVASGRSFGALAGLCLDQIRQNAKANPAVQTALLRTIETAGQATTATDRRAVLAHHAALVRELAETSIDALADRQPIIAQADRIIANLR